jgi:DNA-binding transcriptional ArsR family regulator
MEHGRKRRRVSEKFAALGSIAAKRALHFPRVLDNRFAAAIVNRVVQSRSSQKLDTVIAAISDPTRRAIVDRLARGPASISDVAAPFPMTLTGFCKHVRVLEKAGLVRRTRRGRENTLELSAEPLRDVATWVFSYASFWNARIDQFERHFAKQKEQR